jgi:hypothetical protein
MPLLYCKNGVVLATHDQDQGIPASSYGSGVSVIPWANVATLVKTGATPAAGQPDLRPFAAPVLSVSSDLVAYANFAQWTLATGGYTIALSGQTLTFPTDPTSISLITAKAVRLAQSSPPTTMNWQFPTGFVSISATDFMTAATKMADFVQATFDNLATVMAGITAATITTQSQIDSSSWPAPHA